MNNLNNSRVSNYRDNNSGVYNNNSGFYGNGRVENSSFKGTDSVYVNKNQEVQNSNLNNSGLNYHEDSRLSKNSKTSRWILKCWFYLSICI